MNPLNNLNAFESPDFGRTEPEELRQPQVDQAGFQQHLNELHLRERPPRNPNRRGDPYGVSNSGTGWLDHIGEGTSQLPSNPPVGSEQPGNQHVVFAAANRGGQLPAGSFRLTDYWHGMDSAVHLPGHTVDQEEVSWAEDDDEWPKTPTTSWEHNLGAWSLDRQPLSGDGNPSQEGHRLTPATAQWVEAWSDGRASAAGSVSNPTNVEDAVLWRSQLDQILNSWAGEEEQIEGEDRQEAVRRIKAWGEAGDVYARLELQYLRLTTLPAAFPPDLRSLNVSDNELMHLPDALPDELRTLEVGNNRLTSLPDTLPAALQSLTIGGNQLTGLPVTLPEGLQTLAVVGNHLTSLPETLPAELQDLDVRGNRLTNLPETLPAGLQLLAVGGNRLTSLPNTLPPELQELEADGNRLTSLPESLPAELQLLFVRDNRLASLPETLPAELQRLHASRNRLTSLPEALPAELQALEARDNRLASLPETLLTQLGFGCMVYLEDNPLPERVLTNLATALNAPSYVGPRVFFSMGVGAAVNQARPLPEVVADWLEEAPESLAAWQNFADEAGAPEYASFLDRLRDTVNYGNPQFRQAVIEDLQQAAIRPQLREQYFQLAFGASESCEDRITLTWNSMQTARLNTDVEDGAYDNRLGDLVEQGRVLFRLDALEQIAREKVNSLRFVDEIEVYLAYQVKLREQLELRHIAPDMRFFGVSWVTGHDLSTAETRVRHEEATGFADYLATRWQPWETVVSRIAPEAYAQMQDQLVEAMDEEFDSRLQQRLADHDLIGNSDAERQFGAQIRDEIAREITGALTRQVLADHGLEV
ncbi:NEL-type E3 ubiquitin ligase domain-containing protein [Bradyrhizobium sp. Pa8]|uniref:NEL-type E3 ubiquitin ligase domain-containing protein n=1 Tax=Bradyrhizobium sp. Pa8 TaxID=3386552 RepID=UPI00403F3F48